MALGGARPNSGPKKGAVYRKKISATLQEMRQLEQQTRAPAAAKRCKDILAECANFCAGMMARNQPQKDQNGDAVWTKPNQEEIFLRYMDRACMFAARGAPYFDPTFKAIMVTPPPDDGKDAKAMRVVNMKVFDAAGVAIASEVVEDD
jgi:hypothetical protein